RAFDEMAESLEQRALEMRTLASQLSLAEERERRRIATELHDRVGQALAMSKIHLGALRETSKSPEQKAAVEQVRNLIEQAIQDTRSLLFRISSPILYELGFEAALEWLTEQAQKQHGLDARFEDDKQPKPLDDDIRGLLFQAANELVVNVAKHAHAKNLRIVARREEGFILVSVIDDGVGFEVPAGGKGWGRADGFGLFSIRERLGFVNGTLRIESRKGEGTCVTLKAPLKP
ncbi:MAG TPA: sensor histidine kinase, partial [Syntrophobacteraceae bacterium]|nr:sensor histidine kinase [Syntrophobacteraceae bacterium]